MLVRLWRTEERVHPERDSVELEKYRTVVLLGASLTYAKGKAVGPHLDKGWWQELGQKQASEQRRGREGKRPQVPKKAKQVRARELDAISLQRNPV